MAWAVSPWAASPWCAEEALAGSVVVRVVRTNVIRLTYQSAAPSAAFRATNWRLAAKLGGWAPLIVAVTKVGGDTKSIDLQLLGELAARVDYVLAEAPTASGLLPAPVVVTGPVRLGIVAPIAGPKQYADILVPESIRDVPPGGALGSPSAGPDGDLAGATPTQALRTRVTRMVNNEENAYAHLRGWGKGLKRGALARPSDLDRLRLQCEAQLRSDPDIRGARVQITRAPQGARRAFLYAVDVVDRHGRADRFLTTGEE